MNDAFSIKSIFSSKTIWGIIIAGIGRLTNTNLDMDDATLQQFAQFASVAVEIGGAVLAIYGRIVAKDKLTLKGT
jgi:hypothetical protein